MAPAVIKPMNDDVSDDEDSSKGGDVASDGEETTLQDEQSPDTDPDPRPSEKGRDELRLPQNIPRPARIRRVRVGVSYGAAWEISREN